MTGYKIQYGTVGHDCWGAREFSWDGDYDGVVYLSEDECQAELNALKKKHPYDMEFRIKTVEVKGFKEKEKAELKEHAVIKPSIPNTNKPTDKKLEKEIQRFIKENNLYIRNNFVSQIARHFATWENKRIREDNIVMSREEHEKTLQRNYELGECDTKSKIIEMIDSLA